MNRTSFSATRQLAVLAALSVLPATIADEHPVTSAVSSTVLSGYVDTAAIWNLGTGNAVANRFANTGADRQDGFNINTVKVQLDKPIGEETWAAGYRFEMMFGPDATVMPGRLGRDGQVAIKQAYVALRAPVGNGIDFKVGQYDPIIGYEVTDSYANANFSRSLGFNVLEPFGHQGVLASYAINDLVSVSFGVSNTQFGDTSGVAPRGINVKDNGESLKSYMALISIKAPESMGWFAGSALYAGVVKGSVSGGADPVNFYLGGTASTPLKSLTVGAAFDYLADGSFDGSYGNAWALYSTLTVNEQLKLHGRLEYASSSGGLFQPAFVDNESMMGTTLTAEYSLWANVVTRLEGRWDRNLDGVGVFNGQKNDLSLAANIIYKF